MTVMKRVREIVVDIMVGYRRKISTAVYRIEIISYAYLAKLNLNFQINVALI
jgi:hypothetical protein